jgi:hypothetical protein
MIAPLKQFNRFRDVDECERLLVIGTTLATYSAFRSALPLDEFPGRPDEGFLIPWLGSIVQHALARDKPVLLLNLGPTRADTLLEANTVGISKIDISAGDILHDVIRQLWCVYLIPACLFYPVAVFVNISQSMYSGSRVETDPMLQYLLSAGVITPIEGH